MEYPRAFNDPQYKVQRPERGNLMPSYDENITGHAPHPRPERGNPMSKTIRIDPEVYAHLSAVKREAEGLFGRTYTWSETIRLALQEVRFPRRFDRR